jgi:hypothetical protein
MEVGSHAASYGPRLQTLADRGVHGIEGEFFGSCSARNPTSERPESLAIEADIAHLLPDKAYEPTDCGRKRNVSRISFLV